MMKFLTALKGIIVEAQFGPDYTMSSTIRPLLRKIYSGDGYQIPPGTQWSTVQAVYPELSDVCQTKEGVIGPKELAHPGEEQYNWSIVNRFDTNSAVHNKIKELHSQSGDKGNVYTWVVNNAHRKVFIVYLHCVNLYYEIKFNFYIYHIPFNFILYSFSLPIIQLK